jgi:endonuclease/exonuclease/phosphatase (EEP) superfamily protein YafD
MLLSPVTTERIPRRVRTAPRAALSLGVGGCTAWALVRVFGLDHAGGPLVPLIAFTPYAAAGSVVLLGLAAVLRRWRAAGAAAVAAAALLACVLPRWLPEGGGATDGPRLRLLSSNMMLGAADAGAIVDLVRRHDVEVLTLQEFTPAAARALEAAGLTRLLPHRVSYPQPGSWGSGIFSRFPLRDGGLRTFPSGFTQAAASIDVPGATAVTVESAHPCPPVPPACSAADLANEPPAGSDGRIRILAGDFNSTLDHVRLRRLVSTGYRDAASVRGQGLTPTWPYDEKWWIPGVSIDHVLADRRVGVTAYEAHRIPGSDHRAVFAELVVPRSGGQLPLSAGQTGRCCWDSP